MLTHRDLSDRGLRIGSNLRLGRSRNYWWSSKPSTSTPEQVSNPGTAVTQEAANASGSKLSDATEAVSSTTPSPSPSPSASTVDTEPLQEAVSSVTSTPAEPIVTPSPETLDALSSLQSATSDFAVLASSDFSHLFSWVWPPGLFLRTFSFVTTNFHVTSPIIGFAIAFFVLRLFITPLQIRAQKASARFAPYQDEWFAIQEKYKAAMAEGDKFKAATIGQRMMEIKAKSDLKPFAPILPAVGMAALGIGGFIGAGRLVRYHTEVVEMGGVGPLAYPGGLFGTGILENLTTFSPWLMLFMTFMTWLSTRRAALDAPKYSKWTARMPWLMTPVALFFSSIAQFSNAQMIVATTSITYNVIQSYLFRVPSVRSALGMQDVPYQDPKKYQFPPPIAAWRETFQDWRKHAQETERKAREQRLRDLERDRLLKSRMGRPGEYERDMFMPGITPYRKDSLRVKDAPTSPPPPPPPSATGVDDSRKTIFGSAAERHLPSSATGPPKPQPSHKPQAAKKAKA